MAYKKSKSRYESEVRLGLMLIVLVLLFLNLVSNFILYKARLAEHEETVNSLRQAALIISRVVRQEHALPLASSELEESRSEHSLDRLALIPGRPPSPGTARLAWFFDAARQIKAHRPAYLAESFLESSSGSLTRGAGIDYYYQYTLPRGTGYCTLILSVDQPELAYLDDSRRILLIVQISALIVVALVFTLLSRFIFRPFRRLKKRAAEVGRAVEEVEDDSEAVVLEYERTIKKLRENEVELLQLNAKIQNKADSLEQFNQYLLESSYSGSITLDPTGKVVAVNETTRRILGTGYDLTSRAALSEVFSESKRICLDILGAVSNKTALEYTEYSGEFRSKPELVLGATVSCINDKSQNVVGYLVLLNDLSEVSRLRKELESRNRLASLGEMAGGLAHQIRNSLGAISGYGTLLKKHLNSQNLPNDRTDALLEETREAESLINRFLDFSKPLRCETDPVSLHDLIADVVHQAEAASSARIRIGFTANDDCRVEADQILLKQALGNVIDNAVKASDGDQPLVVIDRSLEDDLVNIMIEDFGCGIHQDDLDKIFTPFFSSRPDGTGLGLALAKKIIDLHGGSLSVQSELDRGTRFTITLRVSHSREGTPRLEKTSA